MDTPEVTLAEFCAGYGGIGLGLRRVIPNLRTVVYVEIEAYACANLVSKMEAGQLDAAPIWTDAQTFDYEAFREKVDIFAAGFPCQPHSLAGSRKGAADARWLFDTIADGLVLMQPRYVFFENVEGLLSSRMPSGQLCIDYIFCRLAAIGYKMADRQGRPLIGLFSAAEVGAPHQRKRVFILGELGHAKSPRGKQQTNAANPIAGSRRSGNGPLSASELGHASSARCTGREDTGANRGDAGTNRRRGEEPERAGPELGDSQRIESERRGEPGRLGSAGTATEGEARERERRGNATGDSGPELGHATSNGRGQGWAESARFEGRFNAAESSEQLADTGGAGLEERRNGTGRSGAEQPMFTGCGGDRWPSRPGEFQHEWESPRTVEPGLGGISNGHSNRVDRLRLLGNGVVPATVAKAWATLFNRL